jgi:hypothetical protein
VGVNIGNCETGKPQLRLPAGKEALNLKMCPKMIRLAGNPGKKPSSFLMSMVEMFFSGPGRLTDFVAVCRALSQTKAQMQKHKVDCFPELPRSVIFRFP